MNLTKVQQITIEQLIYFEELTLAHGFLNSVVIFKYCNTFKKFIDNYIFLEMSTSYKIICLKLWNLIKLLPWSFGFWNFGNWASFWWCLNFLPCHPTWFYSQWLRFGVVNVHELGVIELKKGVFKGESQKRL